MAVEPRRGEVTGLRDRPWPGVADVTEDAVARVAGIEPVRNRPTQAVIVAGGRGTRLAPLTDDRPKVMVEVNGRPFIDELLEVLKAQGFGRVLLLTGYRSEVIERHVRGGAATDGLDVEVFSSDPALETSARMRLAARAGRLDEAMLFCYSDNVWPLHMDSLWRDHERHGRLATVTVYRNRDGWSRSNTRVENGLVTAYDPSRTAEGLTGVEIGYAILPRGVVDLVDDESRPFEKVVYPTLLGAGQLAAHETERRYYSIGSRDRLAHAARFLERRPAVILDRDGVLNRKAPRAAYITSPAAWEWLPGAIEGLGALARAGHRLFIVSNQAGIARGAMTAADLRAVEARMLGDLAGAGVTIEALYHCPHGWDEGCECRKPRPGMLLRAAREHDLDLTRTPVIGDDERDGQAAEAVNAPFFLVDEHRSLLDIARQLLEPAPR